VHQPTDEEMTKAPTKTKDGGYSLWKARIDAAKEGPRKNWLKDSEDAYKEYLADCDRQSGGDRVSSDRFPLYWSSLKTFMSMVYCRPGVPVAEKQFDDLDDNLARLASLALERAAKHAMKPPSFHRAMVITRDTFLHSGKAAPRVVLDVEITDEPVKVYYVQQQMMDPQTQQPFAIWVNDRGEPLTQDAELIQDEKGYYRESPTEKLERMEVVVDPVYREDYLHNPDARNEEEIWWRAWRACLDTYEFKEKFGAEALETVRFDEQKRDEEDPESKAQSSRKVFVWEVWDSRKKQVLFIPENGTEILRPLHVEEKDPYKLSGFFPCPAFVVGTIGDKHYWPVPDYIQLRSLIDQLHALYRRLRILIRAVRRRGLYDSQIPELSALEDALEEGEYIGVENFKELIGDGGLDAIVKHFPTGELSSAIVETVNVSEQLEAKLDQLYGIPDIVRGASDPNETASAQQQKGHYLSLRGQSPAEAMQELVRETAEICVDLMFKKFPETKLTQICGVPFWKQEDQALWPQVMALCQDDHDRKIRITIQTDSTITANRNAEVEKKNYLAKTVFDGIQAMAAAKQTDPELVPIAAEALLLVIQGVSYGKNIEDKMRAAITKMQEPKPEQQPPPDPAIIKAQIEQQMQEKDLAFKQQELKIDSLIKQAELQAQKEKTAAEVQIASYKAEADANTKAFQAKLDAMQLQIEKSYAQLAMVEKFMEEKRLNREEARMERESSSEGGEE
jgi:hypothetical protein